MQQSEAVRTARIQAVETTIGASPTLRLRTGVMPPNCAAADSGTVLANFSLPSDWLTAPASGTASAVGTWEEPSAPASGTAGYWRIYGSDGTCHLQGTLSDTLGSGELKLANTTIVAGQKITITAFTLSESGV